MALKSLQANWGQFHNIITFRRIFLIQDGKICSATNTVSWNIIQGAICLFYILLYKPLRSLNGVSTGGLRFLLAMDSKIVESDMDEADQIFGASTNNKGSQKTHGKTTQTDYEKIMVTSLYFSNACFVVCQNTLVK